MRNIALAVFVCLLSSAAKAGNLLNIDTSLNYVTVYSSFTTTGLLELSSSVGSGYSIYNAGPGAISYNVVNSSSITIPAGASVSDQFRFFLRNPTIYITSLSAGTTAYLVISGGR